MAAYLNKVQLIGRLGADPELVTTNSGRMLAKLRIATTEYWYDNATNEKRERTEWHNIVAWEKTAQFVKNYVSKGNLVYVEGSLRSNDFTDQSGNKRRNWDINANTVLLLQSERKENRDYQRFETKKNEFKDDISPESNFQDDDDVVPF